MTWPVFLCQLYLQNLGIDQSPADILTPFAPRGPIREPEFSPTDLSTVKDFSSGGTPMKSITSSEGPPPKFFFSPLLRESKMSLNVFGKGGNT